MKQTIFLLALLGHLVLAACAKPPRVSSNPPGPDTAAGPATPAPAVTGGPNGFKGFNWADPHDNYSDTVVVPSGLSTSDDYATVQAKADIILSAFSQRGVNTIRLPVNPYSVAGNWWKAYAGAIDKALDKGMRVVLAYWEGTTAKDGLIDDTAQYWRMWQAVTTRYAASANVWFEPFNEPFGYSADNLKALYAQWLGRFRAIPAGRVLLDGVGYATGVNEIGADSRFAGCLLSFHMYTWFQKNRTTVGDWEQTITTLAYPGRTILTEFGVPMTNGKDYLATAGSDVEVAYLQGLTNALRSTTMGSIYWPGLRIGDSYSMLNLNGTSLITNNASGLARLQLAWGN